MLFLLSSGGKEYIECKYDTLRTYLKIGFDFYIPLNLSYLKNVLFYFCLGRIIKIHKISNTALDKNEQNTTTPSSSNSLNSRFPHEKMCLPDTCSNNGICYDSFVDDSSHAASSSGDYYLQWMISPSEPFCDCDLTSYTGSTCSDGNQTFNHHCGFIINKYLHSL